MTKKLNRTQEFGLEWFKQHPGRKFSNSELKDLLPKAFKTRFGKKLEDPTRLARELHELGRIQKFPNVKARHYWYDQQQEQLPEEFDDDEIREILERDNFVCTVCKLGPADGVSVSVGYAVSIRRGGKLDVKNGRTLCQWHRWTLETAQDSDESQHNWRKLRKKLPEIGSPKAENFWNEFVQLLRQYGVDPTD